VWLYRSAAAIMVLAIASSIIYFLAARVDTISNLDTISLNQDKIDEEQAEKTFEAITQKSDSDEMPQLVKKEMQEEAVEILKSKDIKQDVVVDYQEADIEKPARTEIQSLAEEKIEMKTLSVNQEAVADEEIDYKIEFDEPPTAISQEFAITMDKSSEPGKKQEREGNARSASPEISRVELTEARQEIFTEPVGGMEDYKLYLSESLNYPEDARRDNIEGTVIVQCSIFADSLPTNCIIIQPLIKSCDEEAIRLIKEGPKWKLISDDSSDKQQKIVVEVEFKLSE
jgi:TonB family protein